MSRIDSGTVCVWLREREIVFVKVPFASARNGLMFELSDLHKFMAKKAGVRSLDLAFIRKYAHAWLR